MKRCPSCQSTYADDSLSFCLTDGTALEGITPPAGGGASADLQTATLQYPPSYQPSPAPNQTPMGSANAAAGHGAQVTPPPWTPTFPQPAAYSRPKRNLTPWVIGGIIALLAGATIIVFALIANSDRANEKRAAANRDSTSERPSVSPYSGAASNKDTTSKGDANQPAGKDDTYSESGPDDGGVDAPPTDPDLVLSQLTDLENEWNNANIKGNKAVVRRILADEFRGVGADGSVENKEQLLANMTPNPMIASLTLTDLKVSVAGNTAVMTGLNTAKSKAGQTLKFRFTDTFLWRDGRWQAISSQASQVK